jgi:hypothetical protein
MFINSMTSWVKSPLDLPSFFFFFWFEYISRTSGTGVQIPPSDPLMYRLYEFLIVYGFPLSVKKRSYFQRSAQSCSFIQWHWQRLSTILRNLLLGNR